MNEQVSSRIGWIVSILLHLALAAFFIGYSFELRPFDLDYTPVEFAAVNVVESGGGNPSERWGGAQPRVDLPKRPMLEETSPLLKVPDANRQAVIAPVTSGKPDLSNIESLRPGQRTDLNVSEDVERRRAPIKPLPLSDEALYGERDDNVADQIAAEEVFTITWDGPARVKTAGNPPTFPEDVDTEATVRLKLVVAPDGSIVSIRPITKGNPKLERVSIEALRTWRFNPLDRSLAQKNQEGVITFIYKLD